MTGRGPWLQVRQVRVLAILAILVVAAAGLAVLRAAYSTPADASMSVSPQTALLDQPLAVSVSGLPAGELTTVTAKATDAGGTTWSASARFRATSAGVVSLDQPSLGGSYGGVNPMGLFDLMAPPSDSTESVFLSPEAGYDVSLEATVGDRVAAETTAHRQGPAAVGVVEQELRPAGSGIYGNLYLPKNSSAKRPAMLVFGGSDGGLRTGFAASLLAAHGYPSLALAYFDEPGLPQGLADIPLRLARSPPIAGGAPYSPAWHRRSGTRRSWTSWSAARASPRPPRGPASAPPPSRRTAGSSRCWSAARWW